MGCPSLSIVVAQPMYIFAYQADSSVLLFGRMVFLGSRNSFLRPGEVQGAPTLAVEKWYTLLHNSVPWNKAYEE